MERRPTFTTNNAGILSEGDDFEYQPSDAEGAGWQVFTFRGHITADNGAEHINCYGGDPIKADYGHRRQWHAFDTDSIKTGARPVRAAWRSKR